MRGRIREVVIYFKFHENRSRGLRAVGGRKSPSPIDKAHGLYNSLYYRTSVIPVATAAPHITYRGLHSAYATASVQKQTLDPVAISSPSMWYLVPSLHNCNPRNYMDDCYLPISGDCRPSWLTKGREFTHKVVTYLP